MNIWLAAALTGACMACSVQQSARPVPTQPAGEADQPVSKPPEDTALMRQLEEINARTVKIKDLSADFEQRKFTPLLKNPMVSTGRLKVRGSVVLWDTLKPEPSVMRIDAHELRLYYPAHKVVEVYQIGEDMRRLSSSPLPRLDNIRKQFAIARSDPKGLEPGADSAKVVGIVMTPTVAEIKEHVRTVKVNIDSAAAHATAMEITDADGDRTLIVFSRVKLDSGLTERDLALQVPAGTKVTNPLSGDGERR
jgi:outer membrane lipoprotein-sorting protein